MTINPTLGRWRQEDAYNPNTWEMEAGGSGLQGNLSNIKGVQVQPELPGTLSQNKQTNENFYPGQGTGLWKAN